MIILAPVSVGELVDKLSILKIKLAKISDPARLRSIDNEYKLLQTTLENACQSIITDRLVQFNKLSDQLKDINETIWQIEDDIREHESRQDFGPSFIELARGVYINNDQRAYFKKEINLLIGSTIVEEKSYTDYKPNAN